MNLHWSFWVQSENKYDRFMQAVNTVWHVVVAGTFSYHTWCEEMGTKLKWALGSLSVDCTIENVRP